MPPVPKKARQINATAEQIAKVLKKIKEHLAASEFDKLPDKKICRARFIAETLQQNKVKKEKISYVLRKIGYEEETDSIIKTLRNEGII